MFERSADLYDAFYDALGKDYAWEARRVLQLVRASGLRRARTLLDVACGTGRHIAIWSNTLTCTGVDADPAMLAVARRRCPNVPFLEGDMVGLDLGARFDVVTCLFSSIAYAGTVPRLRRAVRAMAAHLEAGGVLVVEPWFAPGDWKVGYLGALLVDEEDRKAARLSRSSRRRDYSILDFDYLVTDASGTRHFTEHHEMRLFRAEDYTAALEAAGLTITADEYGLFGRGLFLGRLMPPGRRTGVRRQ